MRPQLEAIVRAAVARQLTVAELNAVTRSLPEAERATVLSAIRRDTPRLTLVSKRGSGAVRE
jgi:hypothetical protein